MRLFLAFLLLSFALTNCPTEENTDIVEMTATIIPEEAGEVNPERGSYIAGSEITVEAETMGEGWGFTGWAGDTTASDDSLTFTIVRDMNLVATYDTTFDELVRPFSNHITITDGENEMNLVFGMEENATSGFDTEIDQELPPPPPEGGFYAQFNIPDYYLLKDYRAVRENITVWELEFAPEGERDIFITWEFSTTRHSGALKLTDDPENPSLKVDMKTQSSLEVSDKLRTLYIISQN